MYISVTYIKKINQSYIYTRIYILYYIIFHIRSDIFRFYSANLGEQFIASLRVIELH